MSKITVTMIIVLLCVCVCARAQRTWTLKECIDEAINKNISVNQLQLVNQTNAINLCQSKAGKLPTLNMTDAQTSSSGYSLDPYTYQYTTRSIAINNVALTSSITLYNGYLLLNTVRQNKLVYEAGTKDVEKLKNDITLNVLAAYMQVLMDYDAIEIAQAQVEASSTQEAQTEKFVQFGKVAQLNLFQIQSQLASDKLTKVNAENQLQLDKLTLLQLMQTPVTDDFDIEKVELKELFPETPLSTEKITEISESFLPQIKSASLKTNAASYGLKVAESGWYPKLTLGGTLKTGYSSIKNVLTPTTTYQNSTIGYLNGDPTQPVIAVQPETNINSRPDPFRDQLHNNYSQALSLSLSIPIFNNYQVRSNVAIAKVNVANAQLNEWQTKNDLRKNVEVACTNQVSAGKKLVATEEQLNLEYKTYTDMENKFTAGALDATDFRIEKNNYTKVAMSLIQAKYDYVLKAKIVDFYLGKPFIF